VAGSVEALELLCPRQAAILSVDRCPWVEQCGQAVWSCVDRLCVLDFTMLLCGSLG
jgi:hypothetical protein